MGLNSRNTSAPDISLEQEIDLAEYIVLDQPFLLNARLLLPGERISMVVPEMGELSLIRNPDSNQDQESLQVEIGDRAFLAIGDFDLPLGDSGQLLVRDGLISIYRTKNTSQDGADTIYYRCLKREDLKHFPQPYDMSLPGRDKDFAGTVNGGWPIIGSTRRKLGVVKSGMHYVNEDSAGFNALNGRFVVVDGVGGSPQGHMASHRVSKRVLTSKFQNPQEVLDDVFYDFSRYNRFSAPHEKCDAVFAGGFLQRNGKATLFRLGDAKCGVIRDQKVYVFGEDQTLMQHLIKENKISARDAVLHKLRSQLINSLSAGYAPQVFEFDPRHGDILWACTDGWNIELLERTARGDTNISRIHNDMVSLQEAENLSGAMTVNCKGGPVIGHALVDNTALMLTKCIKL